MIVIFLSFDRTNLICIYDFLEKNYKFKHKKKLEEEKTVTNFLHRISDDIIDADIKIIKDLLGNNSLKTTEIYNHVSTRFISKISSPW